VAAALRRTGWQVQLQGRGDERRWRKPSNGDWRKKKKKRVGSATFREKECIRAREAAEYRGRGHWLVLKSRLRLDAGDGQKLETLARGCWMHWHRWQEMLGRVLDGFGLAFCRARLLVLHLT